MTRVLPYALSLLIALETLPLYAASDPRATLLADLRKSRTPPKARRPIPMGLGGGGLSGSEKQCPCRTRLKTLAFA